MNNPSVLEITPDLYLNGNALFPQGEVTDNLPN